ncbi:MAG: anthranilate synthase component I family protein [Candidatus Omnitrophica bacterium]|nr:anthranilate synthase component I family protein [Candidatus Omnitrophota bacterium]
MDFEKIPLKKLSFFYESGYAVPLILRRKDSITPWQLYQNAYSEGPHSFFLDSLEYNPPAQRFSYIGWRSYLRLSFKDHALTLEGEINETLEQQDVLVELRRLFSSLKTPPGFTSEFFLGGAVGYWGYELAQEFEKVSFRPKRKVLTPSLALLFCRDLVVFDHKDGLYYLVTWLIPKKDGPFVEALDQAEKRIGEMESAFSDSRGKLEDELFHLVDFRPEISRTHFQRMIEKTKAYIRAGDIYQANLSQRFSFAFEGSPLKLYDRLRETNPSPFSAFFHFNGQFIASSSPELLVAKKGNHCVTCPIAGTRPRGWHKEETKQLERELIADEKERAEHLMLVDLERNDLGRVSEWKSVRVKDFMRIEKYARVMHIVSEITGKLRPEKDAWDLIRAVFPGGTITGCPKIRSMEIIDELEPVERGVYTGSLGYVGFEGDLMLNIAIRTLVLSKKEGHLQVGAGIVADSDPNREYEETLHKGEALVEALIEASTVS